MGKIELQLEKVGSDQDKKPVSENLRNTIVIIVNMFSSVAIVLMNKYIFTNFGFPNMTLTFVHFSITFIGLLICEEFGLFVSKRLPIVKMIPLSLTYCGFVVLTNLSLQYNTVGTYQVIKVLTAPCVMVISYFFYRKHYSFKVQLTLVSYNLENIVCLDPM
jgi:solute carrier family 35 protein E3